MFMEMERAFLTKLTTVGLVAVAVAIWTQWLSGDPAYSKFPPGPILFVAIAAIVYFGARWWWTPIIGFLISLLTTSGWFVLMQRNLVRLQHPGSVGNFAPGIFIGSALLIIALLLTDVAAMAATVQNFRRAASVTVSAVLACRLFGGIFVLMGVLVIASRTHVDKYHNVMHLVWGALALAFSFFGTTVAKRFCIASGLFYVGLAVLGLVLGNASMNYTWHLGPMLLDRGDHIFHLVLGLVFFGIALLSGHEWVHATDEAQRMPAVPQQR